MILAPLIPYMASGLVAVGVGILGGWYVMDARLDRCKVGRLQDAAQIGSLRAANADLHKAVTDQSSATLKLAEDAKKRQQRAEAALSEINRAQTATRATIARLEASRAASGDCASAMTLVRAEIP